MGFHRYFETSDDEETKTKTNKKAVKSKPRTKKERRCVSSKPEGIAEKNAYFEDLKCKQWRIVMHNLPFKTSTEELKEICSKFGEIRELILPKCKDKRFPNSCAGFAFVQYQYRQDAVKAMETLNMSKIHERKIALDWAVPKDDYESAMYEERKKQKQADADINVEVDSVEENKDNFKQEVLSEEEGSDSGTNATEEDGSDSEETKSNVLEKKKSEKMKRVEDKAVTEGRVVFLRNLTYETSGSDIKEALSKFGNVQLAVCCRYTGSDHSKGTAFVHFEKQEDAEQCIKASEEDPGLFINGRRVYGHRALQRNEAASLEKERLVKKPKDKRNLHLLRVGIIRPGTTAAGNMSDADAEKRAKLAVAAREKLKNLHMFVSPIRLVVHNLPKLMTDKEFRSLCFSAAGNPSAKITEAHIWRDLKKFDAKGTAQSRGFGFAAFTEHRDALAALKHLNNNPNVFSNEKRPIVEFSIENLSALRLRESRQKKGQQKQLSSATAVSEMSKHDLEKTKAELARDGQKPLPSRLGPKIRRRDLSKFQRLALKQREKKEKKQNNIEENNETKKRKTSDERTSSKKRRPDRTKQITKYLALTG